MAYVSMTLTSTVYEESGICSAGAGLGVTGLGTISFTISKSNPANLNIISW